MQRLIDAAREARARAYAPYSGYHVGAAILGDGGAIYLGCNVENVSYPACLCAERAAVGAMVAAGCRTFDAIAISTKDGGAPCGVCLQVLAEFAGDRDPEVLCASDQGTVRSFTLRQLLPQAFASAEVGRTDGGRR
jgi:cytidine deaminase